MPLSVALVTGGAAVTVVTAGAGWRIYRDARFTILGVARDARCRIWADDRGAVALALPIALVVFCRIVGVVTAGAGRHVVRYAGVAIQGVAWSAGAGRWARDWAAQALPLPIALVVRGGVIRVVACGARCAEHRGAVDAIGLKCVDTDRGLVAAVLVS